MERYAVIMAGGAGSRLWPISREKKPKQFISVDGDKCMLIQTIERITQVVPPENCFVITNRNLISITKETLKDIILDSNIIVEPARKNTAACIAYSVFYLKNKFQDGAVCFFPADGYVKNQFAYKAAVEHAYEAAENTNSLAVIGVEPSYPATGYGYIQVNIESGKGIYPVKKFIEKPDYDTAKKFVSSGGYWWNSGIVAGKMDAFMDHIQLFLNKHYNEFSAAIKDSNGYEAFESVKKAYLRIPSISFDKGVLELSPDILAVKSDFDWDDIGNLVSLSVNLKENSDENKIKGKFMGIDVRNSIIYGNKALITAIGVEDMVIAVTDDAVLICPKNRTQDVKLLVDLLNANHFENYT